MTIAGVPSEPWGFLMKAETDFIKLSLKIFLAEILTDHDCKHCRNCYSNVEHAK